MEILRNKRLLIAIIIILIAIALTVSFFMLPITLLFSNDKVPDNWENFVYLDFIEYKSVFDEVREYFNLTFPDSATKITAEDYDENISSLKTIFSDLKYTEIYSDFHNNIFFCKYGGGIDFKGLVYINTPSYVIDIPKSKTTKIDNEDKWIIYHIHNL